MRLLWLALGLLALPAPAWAGEPGAPLRRSDRYGDPLPPRALARLGTIRFRAGGFGLLGLAFLPDGKTLISALNQGHTVQFWDALTGKRLREIDISPLSIRSFAMSPDGRYFAAGGFLRDDGSGPIQGRVAIWEIASGKQIKTLPRSDRDVDRCSMAFTPDGKLLVSASQDSLKIEEVASGAELLRHHFTNRSLTDLAVSPDGSTLAFVSDKLHLWKWQTGEEPRGLPSGGNTSSLAFSPDSTRLAEGDTAEEAVAIWDAANGRLLQKLEPPGSEHHWPNEVTFSPDGSTLFASTYSNTTGSIHLWEARTGRYLAQLGRGDRSLGRLAVSPDSRLLAASTDAGIRVWDLHSRQEIAAQEEAHRAPPGRIVVTPDGRVVTASDDHTIRIWDPASGQQLLKLTHGAWVRDIAVSPDGTKLVSSSLDDTVCLWDLATGRRIYELPGHGQLGGFRAVGFQSDGKSFLSWGDDMYLREWDVATGRAIREHLLRPSGMPMPDEDSERFGPRGLVSSGPGTFPPDGKTFILSLGAEFRLFDVATGKESRTITNAGSFQLTISPDSKLLLATVAGKPVVTKLPDGRTRYSSAPNHSVCLWELASVKLVKRVPLASARTGPVAFSRDGRLFASATDEPRPHIRLWNVISGEEVGAIEGFSGSVRCLAFFPDGKRLVSGMDDTTALVWNLTNHP